MHCTILHFHSADAFVHSNKHHKQEFKMLIKCSKIDWPQLLLVLEVPSKCHFITVTKQKKKKKHVQNIWSYSGKSKPTNEMLAFTTSSLDGGNMSFHPNSSLLDHQSQTVRWAFDTRSHQ